MLTNGSFNCLVEELIDLYGVQENLTESPILNETVNLVHLHQLLVTLIFFFILQMMLAMMLIMIKATVIMIWMENRLYACPILK